MPEPAQQSEDHERERSDRAPVGPIALLVLLGIGFDLALNGQRPGVSIPLLVTLVAVAMRLHVRGGLERDLLLAGAVGFSVFCALRASDGLVALDVLVSTGLLGLAAAREASGLLRASLESFLRRGVHLVLAAVRVPAAVLAPMARAAGRADQRRVIAGVRVALIALPILVVFAALLASADRVFGELLFPNVPSFDLGGVVSHVGLSALGIVLVGTLWLAAQRDVTSGLEQEQPVLPRVGAAEWTTVLAGIDILFVIFVGVQLAVLFGGGHRVEVTPGLTYAEYARSGFFQLIAVAGLTAAVILGGWDLGRRETARLERTFRVLVTVMVGLTGVILASALMRLALYEHTFGFTLNRLAGYVAIGWIGAVLLILLAAIWFGARRNVIAAAFIAALIGVLVVNVMNPERFVAERNVSRFRATGKFDPAYNGSLGLDAVPVLVPMLEVLPDQAALGLRARLCLRSLEDRPDPDWRSANLARAQARRALGAVAIEPSWCVRSPPSDPRRRDLRGSFVLSREREGTFRSAG